jgi:iron complex transport system substrate-binding protein
MAAPRIVSLLPSATEMVFALGCGECLVGRSHECDYPEEVRHLPRCTLPRINAEQKSVELDRQVKARAAEGLALFELDLPRLRELRPDLILTQNQCGVCAIPAPDVERSLREWSGPLPRVLSLSPVRLAEVWQSIQAVAQAAGVEDQGKTVLKQLKNRVADVILKTAALKRRPTVGCLEWLEPLMAAGNWVPELVELAGGTDLLGQAGAHSDWLKWETLREKDPDILVLMPCGFDLARTAREAEALRALPGWSALKAVRRGQVLATDGSQFFNRPGPRLVESLEILAEMLHPALFQSEQKGRNWKPS